MLLPFTYRYFSLLLDVVYEINYTELHLSLRTTAFFLITFVCNDCASFVVVS